MIILNKKVKIVSGGPQNKIPALLRKTLKRSAIESRMKNYWSKVCVFN